MNQDLNNLNNNDFNTQNSNEIPNNQGLNNSFKQNVNVNQTTFNSQPQVNANYQQPINNNLNFENSKKNNKLFIIIPIIILLIIVGIILFFVFRQNKASSNNNSTTNVNENINNNDSNSNQNNYTNEPNKNISNQTALEYFDVSKFDKNKFNGVVYNSEGQYNITDLLAEKSNNTGSYRSITVALDGGLRYAFANDYSNWRTMYSESHKQSSDDYVNALLETLGHPSTYCEKYFDDENGKTGHFYLYYNYGNYVIFVLGYDYRGNEKYNFNYIGISQISISSSDDFEFNSTDDLTCYGEFANN